MADTGTIIKSEYIEKGDNEGNDNDNVEEYIPHQKKVLTAYSLFVQETFKKLEKGSSKEKLVCASRKWSELDSKQKSVWHKKVTMIEQPKKTMILERGREMFVCTCQRKFSHHRHFTHHTKICGNIFSCDICNQPFKNKPDVHRHKRSVHFRKNGQVCEVCNKLFRDLTSLRRHQKVHSDDLSQETEILPN